MAYVKKDPKDKKPAGKPAHRPSKQRREKVELLAVAGTPNYIIADIMEIDPKTLSKYYKKELEQSLALCLAKVAGNAMQKAMNGDDGMIRFVLSRRGGDAWKDKKEVESTGVIATKSLDPVEKPKNAVEAARYYKQLVKSL